MSYVESSAALTAWKKTPELAFLGEDAAWRDLRSMLEYKAAWVRYEALGNRMEVGDLHRVAVVAVV